MRWVGLSLCFLVACGGGPKHAGVDGGVDASLGDARVADGGDDAALDGGDDAHVDGSASPRLLGMNDVTILVPRPTDIATPVLLSMAGTGEDGTAMVPMDVFTRLVTTPGDVGQAYGTFQLVAIRFDLCDRILPGPCPEGADGRLRLIFQPFTTGGVATDVALHAFYPIAAPDLADVVAQLRALSELQGAPTDAPLTVSPGLTANPSGAYADGLRQMVLAHAKADQLMRITLFAQKQFSQISEWALRGLIKHGDLWDDILIPNAGGTGQHVILVPGSGDPTYTADPTTDAPMGLLRSLSTADFGAASGDDQRMSLAALTEIENPLMHTPETVECASCHVTTILMEKRSAVAGVDPTTVAGRYTSAYNLTVTGAATTEKNSLRALGWFGQEAMISQRVVNDTAQVLTEMESRFPDQR